jgi:hypothetical protein
VARIRSDIWSKAVDRSRVLIRIDAATVLSPTPLTDQDGPEGMVSVVGPDVAAQILAQWAQP